MRGSCESSRIHQKSPARSTITLNVSALCVDARRLQPFGRMSAWLSRIEVNAATVPEGVTAVTGTSAHSRALVPSWTKSRTIPAVVVPVATIRMSSTREPELPAVKIVASVPVPSRLVLAVETCPTAARGVEA